MLKWSKKYVWTLRKKTPTTQGSCWLAGFKFKNKIEPSSHFYTGTCHTQVILRGEPALNTHLSPRNACLHMFLSCEPAPIKEFLETYFNQQDWGFPQPITAAQLPPPRLALFWPTRPVPFGPSSCEDLDSSCAWGQTNQEAGADTSFHINQLPSGSDSTFP